MQLACSVNGHKKLLDLHGPFDTLLKAQEQFIMMCGKSSKHGKRIVWMNRDLSTELKCKKKMSTEVGSRIGMPWREIEALPEHAGMEIGKPLSHGNQGGVPDD